MVRSQAHALPRNATAEDLLSIIRTLPDVVFRCVKDEAGRIVWTLNEGRLAEEFHVTTKDVYGKTLGQMFPPAVAARQLPHFEAAFRGEAREWVNELGGRLFKHYPQPVYDAAGRVVAVVGFISEVTTLVHAQERAEQLNRELMRRLEELRVANEGLAQANRDLEAFAAAASHDLRTPLTVIGNTAFVLGHRLGARLDEQSRSDLARVSVAVKRMSNLTADLLRFSRAAQGGMAMTEVDLTAAAWTAVQGLQAQDPHRIVEWRIPDGLAAWGDAGLVQAVLENLLGNAWKYTGKAAHPWVELRQEGVENGRPVFAVRDNGVGFDAKDAANLFQAFQRLPSGAAFPGTGVGLATVRRIVERHGGRIWGEARPGEGATFRFTLGRVQPQATDPSTGPAAVAAA